MNNQKSLTEPLVSVVTPVYNGEEFIRECIESILDQNYDNWEYIILDNCSIDHTPQIIQEYGNADKRIKIYTNDELLPIMDNWNLSLQKISSKSKYCKIVHADDWLFPNCLQLMVQFGEQYSSAGVIGSYTLWGQRVTCDKLPHQPNLISGYELCRQTLKRKVYPFLSPSVLMIRSSLIHERSTFYPVTKLEADVDVMYEILKKHDFAFIPQVLSFIRRHDSSTTSVLATPLNTFLPQRLRLLIKHGEIFLSQDEYHKEMKTQLKSYYEFLAKSKFKKQSQDFWDFHNKSLEELGYPLIKWKLYIFYFLRKIKKLEKRIGKILINSLYRKKS